MMNKTTRLIILIVLGLLAMALIGARADQRTVHLWGSVQQAQRPSQCRGLTEYIEPAPGVVVWLQWMTGPPETLAGPLRLDGRILDDYTEWPCQWVQVYNYRYCANDVFP